MSILKFCRECNNILYPKEDKERKILLYVCGNCDHQEEADDNCVYKCEIKHSNGEHSQVLQDIAVDPTLPRTKSVRCAVCNHPEAVFFKVNITSDEFAGYPRGGRRNGIVFCMLQSKLWPSVERLMELYLYQ